MRFAAGILILLACVLIALGRMHVRRAKKKASTESRHIGRRMFGWSLVLLGGLLMIAGVVLW